MELNDQSLFREKCYIDGAWVDAGSGKTIEVNDPADNSVIGAVPKMGRDETSRAIEAANAAYPAWRAKTGKERAAILRKWHELILENQEDLAVNAFRLLGEPLDERGGVDHLAPGFGEGLALLGRHDDGEILLVLQYELVPFAQVRRGPFHQDG